MSWPLEREGARHFAEGLEEVLVVEEKRAIIENQFKEQLYNWREDVRPRVVGKFDEKSEWILPSSGELTPSMIANVIAGRIRRFWTSPRMEERIAIIEAKERALGRQVVQLQAHAVFLLRLPAQHLDQGARRQPRAGRHRLPLHGDVDGPQHRDLHAIWAARAPPGSARRRSPTRSTSSPISATARTTTRARWRSAPRSPPRANITYKILFNDAVAMTGGQPVDGPLTVPQIARQLAAEGVKRIVVVSDEPHKYPSDAGFPSGVTVHHRDELDAVQRELRTEKGVTALIYDQTCAAEKRRRRKRGTFPDPNQRVFINELVCEGCGDCSVQVELPVGDPGRDGVRPQARDRPVVVQQGLLVPQGLLPELRHRGWRQAAQGQGRRGRRRAVRQAALSRSCRGSTRPTTSW